MFFVVRHKENLQYTVINELDLPDNRHQYILKDEIIELKNAKYTKRLRRVAIWNNEKEFVIKLITNQMTWMANTISEPYKSRCQIEIFFREIKQLLHIKFFIGTSQNAVMIQICTALITILILKALKAIAEYSWHLSNLLAFIRLWLNKPFEQPIQIHQETYRGFCFELNQSKVKQRLVKRIRG